MKMSPWSFEQKLLAELKAKVPPTHRKEPGYKQQQVHREIKKRHYRDLCRLMHESVKKVVDECFDAKSIPDQDEWWKKNVEPSLSCVSDHARDGFLGKKKFRQWEVKQRVGTRSNPIQAHANVAKTMTRHPRAHTITMEDDDTPEDSEHDETTPRPSGLPPTANPEIRSDRPAPECSSSSVPAAESP